MNPYVLPEALIARFRTLSLERIVRIETVWGAILDGVHDDAAIRDMFRDAHTVKGDSRIVGFDEVHLLAQKLEDLLALARQVRYQVSDDLELLVTMAIQFLGILVRRKSAATSGIDLAGFVRQVDDVLRESKALPSVPRGPTGGRVRSDVSADRLSEPTRGQFAIAATTAFLEYLGARGGTSRNRLRAVWKTIRHELTRMHAVPLAAILERHAIAARQLANDLDKHVTVDLDLGDVHADSRVSEAIDVAVLHLVRNAIDHGIEAPDARAVAGKPMEGRIQIRARELAGALEVIVTDDGRGVDLDALRARVVERDLLDGRRAPTASEAELLELLFHPGFSTREEVTALSGRGVGLDAVKSALQGIGGSVKITNDCGKGITVTSLVPASARQIRVYQFLAHGGAVSLAVSARWTPSKDASFCTAVDPLKAIDVYQSSRQSELALTPTLQDLAVRLRWGFLEIALRSATEPVLVTAERICPTPDDHPVEVISIDGREALLLRPEHVPELKAPSH